MPSNLPPGVTNSDIEYAAGWRPHDPVLHGELLRSARSALKENLRHNSVSLHELLCREFPEATDEQIDAAIGDVL